MTPGDALVGTAFLVGFPLFWCAVVFAIGRMSGWAALAEAYPYREAAGGETFRFRTIQMRNRTNYGGCVRFDAGPKGLGVSILFLFRPGHAPFFVPWNEIEVVVRPTPSIPILGALLGPLLAGLRTVEFRFRSAPGIPMRLAPRLVERLRSASGGALRTAGE